MKVYDVVSLLDDGYINPTPAVYDNGTHPRNLNQITSISVHHDASQRPHDYDSVARYHNEAAQHYQRLGPGLQYHFKIDNIGTIYQTRPLDEWLYCVGSSENVSTVAICLDGYFHPPYNEIPTREQYEALVQLLTDLVDKQKLVPWSAVRPHRDFSSTACPGDNLAPYVYAINSKADAQNIPANAVYDWPSEQPSAPPPVTPTPPPTPPVVEVSYRVFKGGKQIGAYKVDENAWNKYKAEGDLIKNAAGEDVTAQLKAKFDPPKPPAPDPTTADHEKRLSALEKLVDLILGYLRKWKRFNKYEQEQK